MVSRSPLLAVITLMRGARERMKERKKKKKREKKGIKVKVSVARACARGERKVIALDGFSKLVAQLRQSS